MPGMEIEPLPQCKHRITSPTHYPSATLSFIFWLFGKILRNKKNCFLFVWCQVFLSMSDKSCFDTRGSLDPSGLYIKWSQVLLKVILLAWMQDGCWKWLNTSMSVVNSILPQLTACFTGVEQHRPQFVLGWVTVIVCQFLLIVFRMRPSTEVPWRCSCGDSMNFPLGFNLKNV